VQYVSIDSRVHLEALDGSEFGLSRQARFGARDGPKRV
jgi:hypothetical protein